MKKIVLLFHFILCSLCISIAQTTDAPMVGGDTDSHGCKPSAGYQWSKLKGQCIRLFEDGIRLDPKAKSLNQTLSAFAIFKAIPDDNENEVEVFIPNAKNSMLLKKQPKKNVTEWRNKVYILSRKNGVYTLSNIKKVVLYQSEGK